ncbi:hypothetical protein TcWFU_000020 [Taenia crassiceps]|uniref:Uncharacterized protein n=1 Tax=Taenia crassiceps TaxID=6207 RepID=A0ABR4QFH8_9CEST
MWRDLSNRRSSITLSLVLRSWARVLLRIVTMGEAGFGSDVRILLPIEKPPSKVRHSLPKKRKMPAWLQKDSKPSIDEVCISGETLLKESSVPSHSLYEGKL